MVFFKNFTLFVKTKSYLCLNKQSNETWLTQYLRGASMEMYTEYLSPSFTGKTFSQTAM
jgi:hypothetical protein